MSLKGLSLTELANILMESALEKKPVLMAAKPAIEPETEQLDEPDVQPAVQTAAPPAGPKKTEAAPSRQSKPVSFKLDSSNIVQAVVFSELLGEPVCKRRRRWRNWS